MKTLNPNKLSLMAFCFAISYVESASASDGKLKLPTWASGGDAANKASDIGKKFVDFMFALIGVAIVVGLLVAAFKAVTGDMDGAKQWGMGVLIGGGLSAMAFGIAAFFV